MDVSEDHEGRKTVCEDVSPEDHSRHNKTDQQRTKENLQKDISGLSWSSHISMLCHTRSLCHIDSCNFIPFIRAIKASVLIMYSGLFFSMYALQPFLFHLYEDDENKIFKD